LFRRANNHQKANITGSVEFVEQQRLFLETSAACMKHGFRLYAPVA